METKNRWEDTGRDCPYCGGEILKRTDQLPDHSVSIYNQCRTCEAQWNDDWSPVRGGKEEVIFQNKGARRLERLPPVPRWVWIALGAVVLFVLFQMGGLLLFRLLIVPLAVITVVWLVIRLGQDQGWWSF